MKMNGINGIALGMILAKAAEAEVAAPTEVSTSAPAIAAESPIAPSEDKPENQDPYELVMSFAGVSFSGASLTKLESQWQSAKGRIRAEVAKRADYLSTLDPSADDRKKSKIKLARNVVDDVLLATNPKAVVGVATEMLKNKLINEGDARIWISYVTLAEALRLASAYGRI